MVDLQSYTTRPFKENNGLFSVSCLLFSNNTKKRKIKTNALLEVDTHLRDLIKLFNEPYSSKDTTAAAGEMCTEKLQLPYWETF